MEMSQKKRSRREKEIDIVELKTYILEINNLGD